MTTREKITIGCIVAAIAVALAIGGYQLGWWLREENVNRTAEIRRDSFERQETLRDQIIAQADDLARVDVQLANPTITGDQAAALGGQRAAMSRQLCSLAADLVGDITPTVNRIIQGEC
jgi:hypothetical protein